MRVLVLGGCGRIGVHMVARLLTAGHQVVGSAAPPPSGNGPLPPRYHRLFRLWLVCGFPAFGAVLAIIWLMLAKPRIEIF